MTTTPATRAPGARAAAYEALDDPRVIRVLVQHRDDVAEVTRKAWRELIRLGVREPGVLLRGDEPSERPGPAANAYDPVDPWPGVERFVSDHLDRREAEGTLR